MKDMKEDNLKKQFQFIHIPKTAGTSFIFMALKQFHFKKKLFVYGKKNIHSFYDIKPDKQRRYDFITGHFNFIHKQNIQSFNYTFLREPQKRLISLYNFVLKSQTHAIHKQLNVSGYTMKDFLTTGVIANFDNAQVRYLSGSVDKPFGTIDEGDLDKAIYNLDTYFTLYGITEQFNESICILYGKLGWGQPFYNRRNTNSERKRKDAFDNETNSLIEYYNRFDKVLYEHALKRFNELKNENSTFINNYMPKLIAHNKLRSSIYSIYDWFIKKSLRL